MNLPDPDIRTLELHPLPCTRLLRHSGPVFREWDGLSVPLLMDAIADAAALGYNRLHIAGDEPLYCAHLHSLCDEGHRRGMRTTLHLAQASVTRRILEELRGSVDLLGIVMEKRPEYKGRVLRCHDIAAARELGIPVSVIFRLTRNNIHDLSGAARFAVEHGAAALSVRVSNSYDGELARVWMMIQSLRTLWREKLAIDFEMPTGYDLPLDRVELMRWQIELAARPRTLGEVVPRIVIDTAGLVLPLRLDFARSYAFGNLRRQKLGGLVESWIKLHSADFTRCYLDAISLAGIRGNTPAADFFDLLSEEAGRRRDARMAAAG
jgi:MoaA/NifB/PqqE/SkfB family radical SAM enzyme